MMMPSIFGESLFDDWFDDLDKDFFSKKNPLYGKNSKNMMKTDIRETDNSYELDIDLPGFKKEEISVSLENGYLTISTSKGLDKDEESKDGQYIRRERYKGVMSRSFFVGDEVIHNDVNARYEDGILRLTIPKKEKVIENRKYIEIK